MGGLSAAALREVPEVSTVGSTATSRWARRSTGSMRPASCRATLRRADVPDEPLPARPQSQGRHARQRRLDHDLQHGRRATSRTRRPGSTAVPATSRCPASVTTTWTTTRGSSRTSSRRSMGPVPGRSSKGGRRWRPASSVAARAVLEAGHEPGQLVGDVDRPRAELREQREHLVALLVAHQHDDPRRTPTSGR